MRLVLHEGLEAVSELGEAWQDLEARCISHPFQTHAFAQAWCDTMCTTAKATPLVVTASSGDRLVGLFPANIVRYGPVRLIDWLGGPYLVDFGDVLYDPDQTLDAEHFICEAIARLRRHQPTALVYLSNVRADGVAWDTLQRRMAAYKSSAAPYLPLDRDFPRILCATSNKHRQDYERRCRRLAEAGEVDFEMLGADHPEFDALLARLLELQRERYEGKGGPSLLFRECTEAFYAKFARLGGGVTMCCLRVAGHPIALSYQCEYRNRMLGMVSAFDPDYAMFSPSLQLKGHLIEACARRGLDVFDFGWGAQNYKLDWATEQTPLSTFVSAGPGGRLLCAAARMRQRLRNSKTALAHEG